MSWMQKLLETYEHALKNNQQNQLNIWPLAHVEKKANIEIVLNGDGDFLRLELLDEKSSRTLIPVTEKSARRTGSIAPHPLCEELGYLANGLKEAKKSLEKNEKYINLIKAWSDSKYSNPKVTAVKEYINKKTILQDIYSDKRTKEEVNNPKCFIRWRIETPGDLTPETWKDEGLIQAWIDYEASMSKKISFCHLSGKNVRLADGHPKFIRGYSDGTRIISQNDWKGFTFRGRFTETKKDQKENKPSQTCDIGYVATHKAHSALRGLIERQGIHNDSQVTIAWALSEKSVLFPINPVSDFLNAGDNYDFLDNDLANDAKITNVNDENVDHSQDLGFQFSHKLKLKLFGYQQNLSACSQVSVMVLDSATTGRMSIGYYREFLCDEYFKQLNNWCDQFSWYQHIKRDKKAFWSVFPPAPAAIAKAAYGKTLTKNLKKQVYTMLLPCIIEGANLPLNIMMATIQRASNPTKHSDESLTQAQTRWEEVIGVACALYRGFYARHIDCNQRKEYAMDLEKNTGRDYLFGRLLAIADEVEKIALSIAKEARPTTAMRLMQRFSSQPMSTWKNIEEALNPYLIRIQGKYSASYVNMYKDLIGKAMVGLNQLNSYNNNPLSGEYLLGYHLQRLWFDSHRVEKGVWVSKNEKSEHNVDFE